MKLESFLNHILIFIALTQNSVEKKKLSFDENSDLNDNQKLPSTSMNFRSILFPAISLNDQHCKLIQSNFESSKLTNNNHDAQSTLIHVRSGSEDQLFQYDPPGFALGIKTSLLCDLELKKPVETKNNNPNLVANSYSSDYTYLHFRQSVLNTFINVSEKNFLDFREFRKERNLDNKLKSPETLIKEYYNTKKLYPKDFFYPTYLQCYTKFLVFLGNKVAEIYKSIPTETSSFTQIDHYSRMLNHLSDIRAIYIGIKTLSLAKDLNEMETEEKKMKYHPFDPSSLTLSDVHYDGILQPHLIMLVKIEFDVEKMITEINSILIKCIQLLTIPDYYLNNPVKEMNILFRNYKNPEIANNQGYLKKLEIAMGLIKGFHSRTETYYLISAARFLLDALKDNHNYINYLRNIKNDINTRITMYNYIFLRAASIERTKVVNYSYTMLVNMKSCYEYTQKVYIITLKKFHDLAILISERYGYKR